MNSLQMSPGHFCNRPIHCPSKIQPHAFFIGVNRRDLRISHLSANCEALLGVAPLSAMGMTLKSFLSAHAFHQIETLRGLTDRHGPEKFERMMIHLSFEPRAGGPHSAVRYEANTYLADETLCFEIEPPVWSAADYESSNMRVGYTFNYLRSFEGDQTQLQQFLCEAFYDIFKFDRVYLCEFDDAGHGYVPASASNGLLPSLNNHHFPAADVPLVARQLYVKNRFRIIPSVQYVPAEILGEGPPLDMSWSHVRDIGATHLQYLQNMGAQASFSFSVVIEDKLTALLGGHSLRPHFVPMGLMSAAQILIKAYSHRLALLQYRHSLQRQTTAMDKILQVRSAYGAAECDLLKAGPALLETLLQLIEADALIVTHGDQRVILGALEPAVGERLVIQVRHSLQQSENQSGIFSVRSLATLQKELADFSAQASGVLSLSLNATHSQLIIWVRKEEVITYEWSGRPDVLTQDDGVSIGPRRSFDTWVEQVKETCRVWTPEALSLAQNLRDSLISTRSEHLTSLMRENQRLSHKNTENEMLLGEVHHRVKNNLAIVVALFDMQIKKSRDLEITLILEQMKSRVNAISSLHQSLYKSGEFGRVDLRSYLLPICENVCASLGSDHTTVSCHMGGPPLFLSIARALPLGLIANEFMINSLKHAFTGRETGQISATWSGSEAGTWRITFQDNGPGSPLLGQTGKGSLGMKLINLLTAQQGAAAEWRSESGAALTLTIPVEK